MRGQVPSGQQRVSTGASLSARPNPGSAQVLSRALSPGLGAVALTGRPGAKVGSQRTGPGDLRTQLLRAVGDPRRAEPPAVLGHPHQHAAPAVRVHADDLPAVIRCLHWGLPFLAETDALQLPASAKEREAPLLPRIRSIQRSGARLPRVADVVAA